MVLCCQGRNPTECAKMVAHIREHNGVKSDPVTVSIEIEKTKSELMALLPLADVVCYLYYLLTHVGPEKGVCRDDTPSFCRNEDHYVRFNHSHQLTSQNSLAIFTS